MQPADRSHGDGHIYPIRLTTSAGATCGCLGDYTSIPGPSGGMPKSSATIPRAVSLICSGWL